MSECKNNCCQNWQIDIEPETLEKYKALDDELKNEIFEHLKHVGEAKDRAVIKLNPEGFCSFVSDKGLCTLQLRYGYDFLSRVCRIYPRFACDVGGSPEYYVELSCEAAANVILFDKTHMFFEEVDVEEDLYNVTGLHYSYALDTTKYTSAANGFDIFWSLRVASVSILQTRKYPIRFRMLLLCMFIQEVANLFTNGQDSSVIAFTDEYLNKIGQNFYDNLSATINNDSERDFDITLDVLKEVYEKQIMFRSAMDNVKKGFDLDPQSWKVPDGFIEKYIKYYEGFLAKNEYIMENYLVHRVLSEGFPFSYRNKFDILSNYVELFAKYNLVEFLITGICRHYMKFDKRHICDCVSLFSRGYEHSQRKFFQQQ